MAADGGVARARVLFVDDEPRVVFALKAMFRGDYDVLTAHSGAEALEVLRKGPVDVVVSDQRMPQMTGVELLRAVRDLRPKAMRILLTGYSDLNAIVGAINEGEIYRFVNKPWTNADLRATVAAAVQASKVEQLPAEAWNAPAEHAGVRSGAAGAAGSAGVAGTARGTGILVIDDDPSTCKLLELALGHEHPLHVATTLEQALGLLEQYHVGVIVTELYVAGESVAEILVALRQHHPSLVAIVLAAQADAAHSIDLINHSQIYRFLRKPVTEGVLRGSVNLAMRRFEILQTHPEQTIRIAAAPAAPAQAPRPGLVARIGKLFRRWN